MGIPSKLHGIGSSVRHVSPPPQSESSWHGTPVLVLPEKQTFPKTSSGPSASRMKFGPTRSGTVATSPVVRFRSFIEVVVS